MQIRQHQWTTTGKRGLLALATGVLLLMGLFFLIRGFSTRVHAAPIPPPDGYPKLRLSTMTVTPTLASTGGANLSYRIEMRNTGAFTASQAQLSNAIPAGTTFNGDAQVSEGPPPTFSNGTLEWTGDIGFDATVVLSFSVQVDPSFAGAIENTAVLDHPDVASPVTMTAETIVTDEPILELEKSIAPSLPGPGKPLTYTLLVVNVGQPALNLPITVTDQVPADTTFRGVGPDGSVSPGGDVVTWTRTVNLSTGASTAFTFTVDVQNVPSGTVITNDLYQVIGAGGLSGAGEVHTATVVDPILSVSKQVWPDPPGSNRELVYTITIINKGSLATGLVITDSVPTGLSYVSGGSYAGGIVAWSLPRLETGARADVSFTASVGDLAEVTLLNGDYGVCSSEGICAFGPPLASPVEGPSFVASASLDPIAKKPGGGTGPVTPTLVVRNEGAGSALDATAYLEFGRISVGDSNDLITIPARGSFQDGPDCGSKCVAYWWTGDIGAGETITFTTSEGQSTIGGSEGTRYTATIVITDSLGAFTTEPVTGTATGRVTHLANLIPTKTAPPVIGRGLLMTYTINVWNSALSTDDYPPYPWLVEVVPPSTTLETVSDGGMVRIVDGSTVISWTLPAMSTGETLTRKFAVRVDDDLISGTQIVNTDYRTYWYEIEDSAVFSSTGQAVTTTVRDVGLIDSFKEVAPAAALPGPGNVLTHYVHIVNTSPYPLNGVTMVDLLPWEHSTYQRDAVASAGQVNSDIVNVSWTGDLAAFSSETVTFTVLVDPDYEGPITNTATISHSSLLEDVVVQSVAYITDDPVLQISKTASPDRVRTGNELLYTIRVTNLGQQATGLEVYDSIPGNAQYVQGSASAGGQLVGNLVRWSFPVLDLGETRTFSFRVLAIGGREIRNTDYGVTSAKGAAASGIPLVTPVIPSGTMFLPLIVK